MKIGAGPIILAYYTKGKTVKDYAPCNVCKSRVVNADKFRRHRFSCIDATGELCLEPWNYNYFVAMDGGYCANLRYIQDSVSFDDTSLEFRVCPEVLAYMDYMASTLTRTRYWHSTRSNKKGGLLPNVS